LDKIESCAVGAAQVGCSPNARRAQGAGGHPLPARRWGRRGFVRQPHAKAVVRFVAGARAPDARHQRAAELDWCSGFEAVSRREADDPSTYRQPMKTPDLLRRGQSRRRRSTAMSRTCCLQRARQSVRERAGS